MDDNTRKRRVYGSHKASILATLNSDRQSRDSYCDVTLMVENKAFSAHRCILGKLSQFFDRMFKSEMKEKYESLITIHSINASTMKDVLNFMYTASVDINEDSAFDVLAAADYLQMDELKELCSNFISGTMDSGNCLTGQLCGQLYNCPNLSNYAEMVGAQNFENVVNQNEFKELRKEDAKKFLLTRDQKAFGAKEVYEATVGWVYYDLENRKEHFIDLLKIVKLHLLPTPYLQIVANEAIVKESAPCKDYLQEELLLHLKLPKPVQQQHGVSEENSFAGELTAVKSKAKKVSSNSLQSVEGTSGRSTHNGNVQRIGRNQHKQNNISTSVKNVHQSNEQRNANDATVSSYNKARNSALANARSSVHQSTNVELSKELVRILRHGSHKQIKFDSDGYARVHDILRDNKFKTAHCNTTLDDIKNIVHTDEKSRFELKLEGSIWKIRATYGHTCKLQNGQSLQRTPSAGASNVPFPGMNEVLKELVRILRHGRYNDIDIDSAGYVYLQDILRNPRFRRTFGELSLADIEYLVDSSDKVRFEMNCVRSQWKIRATSGHTIL